MSTTTWWCPSPSAACTSPMRTEPKPRRNWSPAFLTTGRLAPSTTSATMAWTSLTSSRWNWCALPSARRMPLKNGVPPPRDLPPSGAPAPRSRCQYPHQLGRAGLAGVHPRMRLAPRKGQRVASGQSLTTVGKDQIHGNPQDVEDFELAVDRVQLRASSGAGFGHRVHDLEPCLSAGSHQLFADAGPTEVDRGCAVAPDQGHVRDGEQGPDLQAHDLTQSDQRGHAQRRLVTLDPAQEPLGQAAGRGKLVQGEPVGLTRSAQLGADMDLVVRRGDRQCPHSVLLIVCCPRADQSCRNP